jgi:Subtilase family/Secretion system C-terminal sorting domain
MQKFLLIAGFLITSSLLFAQAPKAASDNHIAGEIVIQFHKKNLSVDEMKTFLVEAFNKNPKNFIPYDGDKDAPFVSTADHHYTLTTAIGDWGLYQLNVSDLRWYDDNDLLKAVQNHPSVKNAQFNQKVALRGTPNDPLFPQQWYLPKIGAPAVWDKTTGGVTACGDSITVAVIEIGFLDKHPDLNPNVWVNKNEIPNNGIDDDNNGRVDDYRGWNVFSKKDRHDSTTSFIRASDLTHGVGVSGVIAAKGNNGSHISGVNWNGKVILLSGISNDLNIVEAYKYILDQHKAYLSSNGRRGAFVPVTNMSAGFNNSSPARMPWLCEVYDSLGKYGILNFVAVANTSQDVETSGDMPTLCAKNSMVAVTGTGKDDNLSTTAFSSKFVHLGAPAEGMVVLGENNGTMTTGGTSFATPLTAGSAALLWSIKDNGRLCQLGKTNPTSAMTTIKDVILRGVEKNASLSTKTVSGGRLNLERSYNLLLRSTGQPIGDFDILKMFPNPVSENLKVVFQLPESVDANVVVVNSLGQIVMDRKISDADLLKNPYLIDTKHWASGLYILTVRTRDFETSRKFVVVHR